MVSLDLMPRHDEGVMRMAGADIARMKKVTKQKRALSMCDTYRVFRSNEKITIEFLETIQREANCVRLRMIYELAPPFA